MSKNDQTKNESKRLLTVHAGALNITIIPAIDSPDWVLPSSMIVDVQLDPIKENGIQRNTDTQSYVTDKSIAKDQVFKNQTTKDDDQKGSEIKRYVKWNNHALPVYSLVPDHGETNTLVVISSTKDQTPFGLLIYGEPEQRQLRIADINDIEEDSYNIDYPYVSQAVQIDSTIYVVPDIESITSYLLDA